MALLVTPPHLARFVSDAIGWKISRTLTAKDAHDSAFSRTLRNLEAGKSRPSRRTVLRIQQKIEKIVILDEHSAPLDFGKVIAGGVGPGEIPSWRSNREMWNEQIGPFLPTFWQEVLDLEDSSDAILDLIESGNNSEAIEALKAHRFRDFSFVSKRVATCDPRLGTKDFSNALKPLYLTTVLYLAVCVALDLNLETFAAKLVPMREQVGQDKKIIRPGTLWYKTLESQFPSAKGSAFLDFIVPPVCDAPLDRDESRRIARIMRNLGKFPSQMRLKRMLDAMDAHLGQRSSEYAHREGLEFHVRATAGLAKIFDAVLKHAERMSKESDVGKEFDPLSIFADFPAILRKVQNRRIADAC